MLTRRNGHKRVADDGRGQTLVELALTAPLFFMVFVGIIVFGIAIFYQQQLTNAAREGARFASISSATARCPVVSNLTPDAALLPLPNSYSACDPPSTRWPKMTAFAREKVFGLDKSRVQVTACWSGYWTKNTSGAWAAYDQIARDPVTGLANDFRECTVRVFGWCGAPFGSSTMHVINPRTGLDPSCPGPDQKVAVDCTKQFPLTTATDDMASNYAASNAYNANQVTVLTCYSWSPPLAGFLLIPETHNIVGVITEALEYQQ
jgi:hypothetical protein